MSTIVASPDEPRKPLKPLSEGEMYAKYKNAHRNALQSSHDVLATTPVVLISKLSSAMSGVIARG